MTPAVVDLRVLGPLELRRDGTPVALPGGKPRALLAVLTVNRNRVVSSDGLADAIWDGEPPVNWTASLQVFVSSLRRALRAAEVEPMLTLVTQAPGYRLQIDDALVDAGRFARATLVGSELLRSERYAPAADELRTGLAEWRGPALADLRGRRFADEYAVAVEEDRLLAVQARVDADLACDENAAVIAELRRLTTEHPLREPFWAQLVTALYRLGRQAEALAALRAVREILADELGIDPGAALRRLERVVLAQEPLPAPAGRTRPPLTAAHLAAAGAGRGASVTGVASAPTVAETALVSGGARVVVLTGPTAGRAATVRPAGLRIGRMPDNDLVVTGEKVSRHHAEIRPAGGGYRVVDLRSTNGVHVNGRRIDGDQQLRDGDVLRIGGVELRLEVDPGP
ncbi:FHA domain-containing protein [Nakamurella flava]|uniref:FHA domain-containing protein n=1 Tax=Nakamurella flava TaxID=2576308 RepID=A0A4U6QKW8_9ACTN|nr:BTAD domain-containing putative transcriptional regulator [Nakamurella flava]TKV60981.1 FHA domain-containing protein [Nakamurella flava]